jgi:rhodanese-related sulfurtransferase/thioredoxin-related protein
MILLKKQILLIIGLLLFVFSFGLTYSDYVIDNKLNEAYTLSQLTEKPLIILFSIKSCHDCVDLKEKTLSDKKTATFLKERFIIVDINPVPIYFGRFPINDENAENYPYSTIFKDFSVSRTPTMIFFDNNGNYVNRLQGFYETDFLLETIKTLNPLYQRPKGQVLKLIEDMETAKLFLETLPNIKVFSFEHFKESYDELNPLDYYIIEQATFNSVKNFLDDQAPILKNVYVYEGELGDYHRVETQTEEKVETTPVGFWTDVNKSQVQELLSEEEELVILDVRTPQEYDEGHIAGAININILSEEFEERVKSMDKNGVYLVYCKSGGRSITAVKVMTDLGFEYIYHYPGGYSDFVK